MALGEIFQDDDRRGVRLERELEASADDVWRALSTPEGVGGWLAPAVRWRLEPGERWKVAFGDGRAAGVVVAVEPGRRLELTWREGAWWSRYHELRPAYEQAAARLGPACVSPVPVAAATLGPWISTCWSGRSPPAASPATAPGRCGSGPRAAPAATRR